MSGFKWKNTPYEVMGTAEFLLKFGVWANPVGNTNPKEHMFFPETYLKYSDTITTDRKKGEK